jgi:hypothetical protein
MFFAFEADERENVIVSIIGCQLCKANHKTPLLRLEIPIRVQPDHATFKYRIRCPLAGAHILIADIVLGPHAPKWHVVDDTPEDLVMPPPVPPPDKP